MKKKIKQVVREIKVASKEDKIIVEKAIKILDKAGYVIAPKGSLVLDNEMILTQGN